MVLSWFSEFDSRVPPASGLVKPLAWLGLLYFTVGTLFDDDDEEEEKVSIGKVGEDASLVKKHANEKDAKGGEDTIFIPLGFAYQLPQKFYRGSDPEWKSFVQLSQNNKKKQALKNELTGFIGRYVGAIPQFEEALGKGSRPRKHWLDIDFPDGPPPEYERKGLEIAGDHISWATRPVHPLHYTKLQKALWPTSLASSIWASYKTMASLQFDKLKSYLKLSSEPASTTPASSPALTLQKLNHKISPPKQESSPTPESKQPEESVAPAESVDERSTSQDPSESKPFQLKFPPPGVGDDLASAATAFKTTFSQTWRPASIPPERGTVIFSGMVELVGPKGVMVLDVRGAYHAADSKWTKVGIAVRRVQSKRQRGHISNDMTSNLLIEKAEVHHHNDLLDPLIGTVLLIFRHWESPSKMPDLTFVLPGFALHNEHGLECSPTATPAQTPRSTSPVRGGFKLHSSRQAAEFVSKLHDITEVREIDNATGPYPHDENKDSISSLGKDKVTFKIGTFEHSIPAAKEKPTHTFDRLDGRIRTGDERSITNDATLVPEHFEVEGMAQVSSIDGSASVSAAAKIQVLLIYFAFNLGLTLYNKAVMIKFPFPFMLTALHAASGMVGTQILLSRGIFTLKNLTGRDTAMLSAFSILYTANIAVSNVSLAMVTVPFHQTVRALTPVFTVAIYRMVFHGLYGTDTYISLVPVIIGVMLASYGDLNATILGFVVTMLGTVLAAVKTVTTNRLQTSGLHLGALELLYRMSPIACMQSLAVAYICGEFNRFDASTLGRSSVLILLVNGAIAFGLNVASFEANKRSGALTMTIAANVKQVLTIVLSVVLWNIPVGVMNACGIVLTIVGGAWYGRVELLGKAEKRSGAQVEEGADKV
ncbi:MAG: hypothetical protein Q9166_002610 [cf. Caloplaca sp. 2 TL-2023]